mmetsp:Transcript_15537/g.37269  ORF Transcript_15537/g.37269 Transcript_15537/m.37269 type:complete len:241 (-) Transcript_15537:3399-4121(-)
MASKKMSSPYLISVPITQKIRNSVFCAAWQQNDAIRFGASGILGNAIFFGLDKVFFPVVLRTAVRLSASNRSDVARWSKWIHDNAGSVSFFVAYLLDISVQHLLNAWLVFGFETISTRELYFSSLATAYTAYFGTLCGSTIFQAYLLSHGTSKSVAFWTTIVLGSLVNYFVLTSLNADESSTTRNHLGKDETNHCSADKISGKVAMIPVWRARGERINALHFFTDLVSSAVFSTESQLEV